MVDCERTRKADSPLPTPRDPKVAGHHDDLRTDHTLSIDSQDHSLPWFLSYPSEREPTNRNKPEAIALALLTPWSASISHHLLCICDFPFYLKRSQLASSEEDGPYQGNDPTEWKQIFSRCIEEVGRLSAGGNSVEDVASERDR